jgi:hypothetical protein
MHYKSFKYPLQIMKRTREMEQEVEALKVELGKTEVELQQWVTDVKDWAAASRYLYSRILCSVPI